MFILDTPVVAVIRKIRLGEADPQFGRWADSVNADDLFITCITVMELSAGILKVDQADKTQGSALRYWLEQAVLREFEGRIFPIDTAVAQCAVHLKTQGVHTWRDALMAAASIVHGAPLVTGDMVNFQSTGAVLFDPWKFNSQLVLA